MVYIMHEDHRGMIQPRSVAAGFGMPPPTSNDTGTAFCLPNQAEAEMRRTEYTQCEVMTLTFDLGGHYNCWLYASWYLSEYQVQILVIQRLFVFDLWAIGITWLKPITWPCDLDLWPWRSWLLRLTWIVVLHPYTKTEVRRLCRSEDMAHDVCQH